jgi:hypothetical protein
VLEVNLSRGDVAICAYGANEHTGLTITEREVSSSTIEERRAYSELLSGRVAGPGAVLRAVEGVCDRCGGERAFTCPNCEPDGTTPAPIASAVTDGRSALNREPGGSPPAPIASTDERSIDRDPTDVGALNFRFRLQAQEIRARTRRDGILAKPSSEYRHLHPSAIHEAGHAVMARLAGYIIDECRVAPDPHGGGNTAFTHPPNERATKAGSRRLAEVIVAGRVAEDIHTPGLVSPTPGDLAEARAHWKDGDIRVLEASIRPILEKHWQEVEEIAFRLSEGLSWA